jgi:hypothetical protein
VSIKKHPEIRDQELETLRAACQEMARQIDILGVRQPKSVFMRSYRTLAEQYNIAWPLVNRYRTDLARWRIERNEPMPSFKSFTGSSMPAAIVIAAECLLRHYKDGAEIQRYRKGK